MNVNESKACLVRVHNSKFQVFLHEIAVSENKARLNFPSVSEVSPWSKKVTFYSNNICMVSRSKALHTVED